jgi:hypothetical protein
MLNSASAAVGGIFSAPLKARNQTRTPVQGARVKNGLGIGPLRATSSAPGALQSASAQRSSLVTPPSSGGGVLAQLNGQVRSVSPLTAGVRTTHRSTAVSTGVLQARQAGLLGRLRQTDNSSRLLQASASPLRMQGGFGLKSFSSSISLLG